MRQKCGSQSCFYRDVWITVDATKMWQQIFLQRWNQSILSDIRFDIRSDIRQNIGYDIRKDISMYKIRNDIGNDISINEMGYDIGHDMRIYNNNNTIALLTISIYCTPCQYCFVNRNTGWCGAWQWQWKSYRCLGIISLRHITPIRHLSVETGVRSKICSIISL